MKCMKIKYQRFQHPSGSSILPKKNIIKKEFEIFAMAKGDLKVRTGFLFKRELEKLLETSKKPEKRSVDV